MIDCEGLNVAVLMVNATFMPKPEPAGTVSSVTQAFAQDYAADATEAFQETVAAEWFRRCTLW